MATKYPDKQGTTLGAPLAASGQQGDLAQLPSGYVLAGRYEILEPLGRGGMGAVYAARNIKAGRVVAVKVLLPHLASRSDLVARFIGEARAAAALDHPHIVEVHDFDRHDDLQFMVMERLEGVSLAARLRTEGPLPVAFAARIGAEICDAMTAAHGGSRKVIHRDLKPENVFLARKGRQVDTVKVLDFGVAKLIEPELLARTLTSTGEVTGTPLYMAPEQLRSAKDVDERADIYSIGVILYEAMTGRLPFTAESLADLVLLVHGPPPPAIGALRRDVPQGLIKIVERAMARERDERFPTAEALREALLPFTEGERGPAPPPPSKDQGRRVWAVVGVGVATTAVLGGLGVWLGGPEAKRPAVLKAGSPPALPAPSRTLAAPDAAPDARTSFDASTASAPSKPRPARRTPRPARTTSPGATIREPEIGE